MLGRHGAQWPGVRGVRRWACGAQAGAAHAEHSCAMTRKSVGCGACLSGGYRRIRPAVRLHWSGLGLTDAVAGFWGVCVRRGAQIRSTCDVGMRARGTLVKPAESKAAAGVRKLERC